MLKRKRETDVEIKTIRAYRDGDAMRGLRDSVSALLDARSAQPPGTVDISVAAACQRYARALRALEQGGLVRVPASSATFRLEYNTTKTRAWLANASDFCADADVRRQAECAAELYDDLLDRMVEDMVSRSRALGPQRADDAVSDQLLALAGQIEAILSRPRDVGAASAASAASAATAGCVFRP